MNPVEDYQSNDEDSFDFDKYNRNNTDSVDTLELLKESNDDYNDNSNEDQCLNNSDDEANTLSPSSPTDQSVHTTQDIAKSVNWLDSSEQSSIVSSVKSSLHSIARQMKPAAESLPVTQLVPVLLDEKAENSDDEVELRDLEGMEQKLRDAWIKMRKLDLKLARCAQKERSVKRETLALIEKNRVELNQLRVDSNHKETKWETENTAHFLALTYVDLDDEIKREEIEDSGLNTPLFKTEMPYDCDNISLPDEKINLSNSTTRDAKKNSSNHSTTSNTNSQNTSKSGGKYGKFKSASKPAANDKTGSRDKNTKDEKVNFIKRNIQLAQDGGSLAMTDEEKQRLNELLIGTEEFDVYQKKIRVGEEDDSMNLVEYNPFLVSLMPGDGFTPDTNESQRLNEINSRLEQRMSRINSCINGSIGSSSRLSTTTTNTYKKPPSAAYTINPENYQNLLQSEPKQIKLGDDFDENDFGDKFIREARVTREQEIRLKQIESQLERMKNGLVMRQDADGSEIDLQSETGSVNTVALVDEYVIKELIEEFNFENSQTVHKQSYKLGMLKEEDDNFNDDESDFLETYGRMNTDTPNIHETVLNSLIEQAKNEGIVANYQHPASPINSYYDEALEMIRSSSSRQNKENIQNIPEDLNYQEDLGMKTANLFENKSKKLPPLIMNKSEPLQEDSRPLSSMSNSSTTSSAYLPKIDSRFLPK